MLSQVSVYATQMDCRAIEYLPTRYESFVNIQTLAQCPDTDCDGDHAFFFQKQIRSADEPMTTFYKVKKGQLLYQVWLCWISAVYEMRQ